ncbi:2-dehydropantoate 2-reductase [Fusarium pseudoanthophilum]|uniref:2-dehydropantoate 2-reductase n=1 Tax=Fusarium pseudoanthophilum TaxID=48495 RepID=A0A8H5Q4R3_9HYPO|nr:2-dehydropantoate 2-reductase [Fusarium pseudoanthophilum]
MSSDDEISTTDRQRGIGTIAALNLEKGGSAEVTSVLRSNYKVVRSKGFTIRSCQHGDIHNWRPTETLDAIPSRYDAQGRPFDYIVCCTKDIPDIIPTLCDIIAPAVTPGHTAIILIQNGLNIEIPFIHQFPNNVVVSGISRIDAHEVAPGVIEHKRNDVLHIGAFNNPSLHSKVQEAAAKRFVEIYSMGGKTKCLYKPDVGFDLWSKLVYNASFNPICALTRLNTGELQRIGRAVNTLVIPAMEEVMAVAKKAGHELPKNLTVEFCVARLASEFTRRCIPSVDSRPTSSPQAPGVAPNLGLLDLELMHNFCTSTYATLSNDVTVRDLWRVRLVRLCLKCDYAMLAILSVSALHLSHFSTERKELLRERAIVYHNQALSIAAPFIDAYDNANAQELFAFSILTIYYSFAQTPQKEDGPYPPWVVFINGCASFASLGNSTLSLGPFSALLSKARRRFKIRERVFEVDYVQQLKACIDETITDPVQRSIYQDTLRALNQTFGVFYETDGEKDLVDIFSWTVPAKAFFEFVADEEPEALVVLSYFCVLLHKLPSQWWLSGWVNHIMTRIYASVGEKYLPYLVWPMEEIGWIPKN